MNKNKKSKWFMASVSLATIAVLLSGTVLALKVMGKKDEGSPPIVQEQPEDNDDMEVLKPSTETNEEIVVLPEENEPVEEEPTPVEQPTSSKLALDYVPKPNLILTYYHEYTSGETGEEREITAKIDPEILVSKAITIEEYPEALTIYHYVEGIEGIYLIQNDNPEDNRLWLPNNPQVGDTWEDPYNEFKIMDMGVTIEVGGKTFENCIMRKNNNLLVEFINISYIAPGYGEVASVYQGGSFEFELVEEEIDEFELGQDLMKDKLKFLEGILSYRNK